ncbi:mesenteric estrogen-dependent adipogenesis protein-like [Hippoglossus hippoglossus]|uniref:mesenteric estrogen-dependent adipogenesis protein-like n=1 Tax=Hippoglossus hippoglossus TaxID=8267 RepID=UPI00148E6A68|nr:mesenteric estrogen-dependent adipogenesis protein-like [Hippoglossus hippoglossus]XP_035033685.1 mesenteric estrogen-dependent adipogenesis protein [Hippoglossus stenolepis]
MAPDKTCRSRMTVTEVEVFLREPPPGFTVEEAPGSGYRVRCDPEKVLVLIDDFQCSRGKIVFQNSPGRKVKMHDLWEYTSMRKSLLSKRIYLLTSACQEHFSAGNKKAANELRVLQQYVVSIDGSDPLIKWQLERGLDWTISSVAGESYRVDIDLAETLESWAAKNIHIESDKLLKVEPVWRDASFTLKYYSDALFDFPHWFGFSKRNFKLRLT